MSIAIEFEFDPFEWELLRMKERGEHGTWSLVIGPVTFMLFLG